MSQLFKFLNSENNDVNTAGTILDLAFSCQLEQPCGHCCVLVRTGIVSAWSFGNPKVIFKWHILNQDFCHFSEERQGRQGWYAAKNPESRIWAAEIRTQPWYVIQALQVSFSPESFTYKLIIFLPHIKGSIGIMKPSPEAVQGWLFHNRCITSQNWSERKPSAPDPSIAPLIYCYWEHLILHHRYSLRNWSKKDQRSFIGEGMAGMKPDINKKPTVQNWTHNI